MGYVLEFRDGPAPSAFDMPPETAIEFFKGKGLRPTFSYLDMAREEHDAAFTVAKMLQLDLLKTTRDHVDRAISQGWSIGRFRKELGPRFKQAGWWGIQELTDPVSGVTVPEAQLGSAHRLNTIYRANLQSAYSVGRWERIEEDSDRAPWLMYDAVDDFRTREEHADLDTTVLRVTDPFWRRFMPPNGYNCRCGVLQLSDADLERLGLKPSKPPRVEMVRWRNPRTGRVEEIPAITDPGWDHNPGLDRLDSLRGLAREKVETLPPEWQEPALASLQTEEFFAGDTPEMEWHRAAFETSPQRLKEAVRRASRINVQHQAKSGAWAMMGRLVEMNEHSTSDPKGRGTWRHEFGHIIDVQQGELIGTAYYSSGTKWRQAFDSDAKRLREVTGRGRKSKANDRRIAEREEAFQAAKERILDSATGGSKAGALRELAQEADVDFNEFIEAMRAETLILDDVPEIDQIGIGAAVRLGQMLEALKRGDLEMFAGRGLYIRDMTVPGGTSTRAYEKAEALSSLSDLGGATTKNRVAGHTAALGFPGHPDSYYKARREAAPTEAFANITTLMGHARPFWHEVARRMTPAQVEVWEDLIESITTEGGNE